MVWNETVFLPFSLRAIGESDLKFNLFGIVALCSDGKMGEIGMLKTTSFINTFYFIISIFLILYCHALLDEGL